jgi:spermidine/putrescine transport system substrate-binding protein
MKKTAIRLTIVFGWIGILCLSLYAPKISNIWPCEDKTLYVFAWSDILSPEVIARFEQKTGIKVKFNYYSSNEELLVKLKATRGEGYDLIIPSDYALPQLVKDDLLQKIDKKKFAFWPKINPLLLHHFFDPNNDYSIPFEWEAYLLAYNTHYFAKHPLEHSWKMLFDKEIVSYKIAMTSDPIEAILFASFYLFGPTSSLTPEQAKKVEDLLLWQKKSVEVYASFRGDYFLSTGSCQVTVASSSYLWRTLQIFPFIDFIIPKEGTFISIENLAIPKASKKQALVYKLINHLFEEESVRTHFATFGYFPSTLHTLNNLKVPPIFQKLIFSSEKDFSRFYFTQELLPQQKITDIWVEVKSKN